MGKTLGELIKEREAATTVASENHGATALDSYKSSDITLGGKIYSSSTGGSVVKANSQSSSAPVSFKSNSTGSGKTLGELMESSGFKASGAPVSFKSNSTGSGKTLGELMGITTEEASGPKNAGGLGGGLKYLGQQLVNGFVSTIEGGVDFVVGGLADLFGADDYAKKVFTDNWYDYDAAKKEYNPGKGWEFAGEVANAVGGAVPDIALGIGIGLATGGTGTVAKLVGTGASAISTFASGTGRAMNEAVGETGNLGEAEWQGATGSGLLSAGVELASAGLGEVAGKIGGKAGKLFGKTAVEMGSEIGQSATKKISSEAVEGVLSRVTAKELISESGEGGIKKLVSAVIKSDTGKELLGEMVSEGLEEGVEAWFEPKIKQATYSPTTQDATLKDVLRSAALGATTGVLIRGGTMAVNSATDASSGAKIYANETKMQSLLHNAELISNYEQEKQTGSEVFGAVQTTLKKVQARANTDSKPTVQGYADIGLLNRLVGAAVVEPLTVKTASDLAINADRVVTMLNNFYKQKGIDQEITADQLTAGLNMSGTSKDFVKSVRNALRSNTVLREVVINNMLGRLEFDAQNYANSIYGNMQISDIATQENINRFLANADKTTLAAVSEALGISDWANLTPDEFAAAIKDFRDSGRAETYRAGVEAARAAASSTDAAVPLPDASGRVESFASMADGVTRYSVEGAEIAIVKKGEKYRLYDYGSGHITRELSLGEIEGLLSNLEAGLAEFRQQSEMQVLEQELNNLAEEKIPEYKKLTEPEREAVRETIRRARANGLSVEEQILLGRIAAKSGIKLLVTNNLEYDAWYDGKNTVYIKADGSKVDIYSGLLGHEVFHKMFKSSKVKKLFMEAWNNTHETKRQEVIDKYMTELKKNQELNTAERINISNEEVAAAYAQELFNSPDVWDFILEGEPSLADRVTAFFGGVPKRYAFADGMDAAAKRWLNHYQKLFNEVAVLNRGESAIENSKFGIRNSESVIDGRTAYAGEKAKTADKMKLGTAEQMLADGADSETVRKETGWFKGYDGKWRFEINDVDGSLIENPVLQKHEDGGEVYFTGKLSDIFYHKELFAAYPNLEDINIVIQKTDAGVDAVYQPNSNYITLSIEQFKRHTKAYHDYLDGGRRAEIKRIEMSKTYQEYNRLYDDEVVDSMDPEKWLEEEQAAREKFYSSDLGKRYYQLMWGKDGFSGDKFEFGWSKAAKETLLHELQHAIQSREGFASGTNTRDVNYDRNAGEIEARDTARRANMTAEERKNTPPDAYREDVVIKGGSNESFAYIGDTKDGRRCYSSGFDKNLNMDERIELFKKRIATIFNLGAVELKTDVKKIRIRGDRFTAKKNLYGDSIIRDTEYEAKINALYDLADILATATYDPTATSPEESYVNPGTKPKNKAHKGVKYWYKFKNEIVFDGVPYSVTFNIRDKGIEQYEYLIEFKENKTPGLNNTVASNLLQTDQASYDISISNSAQNVKTSGKNSSKNADSGGRAALSAEMRAEKKIANAEAKADKKVAQAEEKAEKKVANLSAKLKAEYETDTVFTKASVERAMSKARALEKLPKEMKRSDLAEEIWQEMSLSDGDAERYKIVREYTIKIRDAILNANYTNPTLMQHQQLTNEISEMMQEIAKSGQASKRAKLAEGVRGEIKAEESRERHILSKIYSSLKRIDDTKRRRFTAASDYKGVEFGGAIEELTRMDWRGELNHTIARKQIKKLSDWYTESNPMLKNQTDSPFEPSYFDHGIRYRLDKLTEHENGKLTVEDLSMLADVTEYFSKLIGEYDRVYLEGKWQSGEDLVYRFKEGIEAKKKIKLTFVERALRNKILSGDFRTFGDTLSVLKLADGYEDGIFTAYYNEWNAAELKAQGEALAVKEAYNDFLKKNPKYIAKASEKTVKLHGAEFSGLELCEYFMTLKREQAWESIAEGGIVVTKQEKNILGKVTAGAKVTVHPIASIERGNGYSKRLEAAIKAERELVESKLTKADKEYIKILEAGYVAAKDLKAEGDMQRLGFVSVIDGYYYPIRHAYTDHLSEFDREMVATDRYSHASFNKHSQDGAKSAISIGNADATFHRHVDGVTKYLYLSPVMDSFNKVYKLKVPDTKPDTYAEWNDAMQTPGRSHSLQRIIEESDVTWRDKNGVVGFTYLQNMMMDTMGRSRAIGDDFAGALRSGYVGFALGANPKVLATQFSSLIASTIVINPKSLWRGALILRRGMDDYSIVARLRDSDYTIAKSESVSENISAVSKFFTMGISLVDRFVVYRAWGACQAEVARTKKLKIGSEENRIEAGKLLDKVILETQQNTFASRKTEGARRGNMLVKTALMFKSDAVTVSGRVIDAAGEALYLKAKAKAATGNEKIKLKKKEIKATRKFQRATGAVVASSVYMLIVAEAFKHAFGKAKDEEPEEKLKRLGADFVGNLIGGLPVLSEIYSYFNSGYELSSMEFDAINDLLKTAGEVAEYAEKLLDGTSSDREKNRLIEKVLYAGGQLAGIPIRNIKNIVYGITKAIDREAAYKWDSALYSQGYAEDLSAAIENGDMQMATTILELAIGEKMGSGISDAAREELIRLSGLGERIIPSAISDKVTIDGVEYELSGDELAAVREKYAEAVERINSFVGSTLYNSYSDEEKAGAIRKIYSVYKSLAYDTVLDKKENEKVLLLSKFVDADALCAWSSTSVINADKDEDGESIDGSKREKVIKAISTLSVSDEQKLVLIAASGYKLSNGDIAGLSAYEAEKKLADYVAGLKISDEERAALYGELGFDLDGAKAVVNDPEKSDLIYLYESKRDNKTVSEVFGRLVAERLGKEVGSKALAELVRLGRFGDDYVDKIVPSAIGDSVTINGKNHKLTDKEKSALAREYSKAAERIDAFVETDLCKSYTNEQRASAIRNIYSLYKDKAYDAVLGTAESPIPSAAVKLVGEDTAAAFVTLGVITSSKDTSGNTITGSKRAKVVKAISSLDISDEQKLMLITLKGYSLSDGDLGISNAYDAKIRLFEYLASCKGLSNKEKLVLFEACGFEVEGTRVKYPKKSASSSNSGSSKISFAGKTGIFGGNYTGIFQGKGGIFSK